MSKIICKLDGCDERMLAKGFCSKHYKQYRRKGFANINTRRLPNEYRICGDITYVGICNIRGVIIAEFIIDTEDMEKVKAYGKWCMSGEYVGSRRDIDKGLRLHRFIMNCPDGLVVNHWNHNKLDCRKINLVVCTSSDNNYYSKKPKGTKYPYKGVFYAPTSRRIRKWCAQFGVNYKKCVISSLNDMEEAAWIYDQIIMQIAGEFAYTNFKWDDRNNYIGADGPDMLV